jgi:uncharacterized protein YyaL (SSP411 family)
MKHTNRLIHETSPYLLQHAHNPVDWYAWGKEALQKAQNEDKPILVSIGYATCHWCHVMERESFENETVAAYMNKHFVCIKIDREERQDLDQIYMDAIQAMGIHGGWPLNVFLLPDTKPFYGGTYFPPDHWLHILQQIVKVYAEKPQDLRNSAEKLAGFIRQSEIQKYGLTNEKPHFNEALLATFGDNLAKHFDTEKGGFRAAPKFPMPSLYAFLLRYYHLTADEEALQHTLRSLIAMAWGGIYDQIGGGFARYSTDDEWLVPHFEKMLYDNAQLLSVYSEAYSLLQGIENAANGEVAALFQQIVEETVAFVQRELTGTEGNFYSALDADSEGIEGKFYIWTKEELEDLGLADLDLFKKYYQITDEGNWEHGYNILHLREYDSQFAIQNHLSLSVVKQKVANWKRILLEKRTTRIRPTLDDKSITSWNALLLKGLCDAYQSLGNAEFLPLIHQNLAFIEQKLLRTAENPQQKALFHTYKNGKATLLGFLDDYATFIQALLAAYQVTFEEKHLTLAQQLTDYTLENFYDTAEGMFFYTDQHAETLIARKKEIFDNVIPASNSIMATNLYWLGIALDRQDYRQLADKMMNAVVPLLSKEVRYLSNWACLYTYYLQPSAEVVIMGKDYRQTAQSLQKVYYPNKIVLAAEHSSNLPLLQSRTAKDGSTTIYVCRNHTCQLPTKDVEKALELLYNF